MTTRSPRAAKRGRRPVVRSADDDAITRFRMARPRSKPSRHDPDDDHRTRAASRHAAMLGRDMPEFRRLIAVKRRNPGWSEHDVPNRFLWARMRIDGAARYYAKAKALRRRRAWTAAWYGGAGYPLRKRGTGPRGAARSSAVYF